MTQIRKITKAADIAKLTPPEKGHRIHYVNGVPGLGLRITAKDVRSWVFNYRVKGTLTERRYTIGRYPQPWPFSLAKDEAKVLRREVDQGGDPMGEIHDEREAPTVRDMAERYIEEFMPKKRESTQTEEKRRIRRLILPKIGNRKVREITLADMDKIHRNMAAHPYGANRTLSVCSVMFAKSIKWGWRETNPCKGVERYPEPARERYLSQKEIAGLSEVLAAYPNQVVANAVRFLLLTGARRGEVLKMKWADVDLETGVWVKPANTTKSKKPHRVPLSAAAMEVLASMERTNDFVFPGRKTDRSLCDLKNVWEKIRQDAGLKDVRLHDLRHSYASILASSGLSLPIIGRLLGHTQPATTARYAHLFDEPLREATEKVAAHVSSASKPTADVVKLRG
jgi:integrase